MVDRGQMQARVNALCVNFEETATKVSRASDPTLFEPPAGIKWTENLDRARADSAARAMVGQLSSQAMADSLAKAKAELAKASAQTNNGAAAPEMTAEQKKQMCDAIKNFSLSTAMNNAMKSALNDLKNEAIKGAAEGAANKVRRGLGGLIRRPQ